MKRLLLAFLILLLGTMPILSVTAQDRFGSTSQPLNVRNGPTQGNELMTTLKEGARVIVEGRNEAADWLLVRTEDGIARGWVAARFVTLEGFAVTDLPVVTEVFADPDSLPAEPIPGTNNDPEVGEIPGYRLPAIATASRESLITYLEGIPVLYNMSTSTARGIFARGQQLGNDGHIFTSVGDSITATQPFMTGFGDGNYSLGGYDYLQPTIEFFLNHPTRTAPNPFLHDSLATESAFSSAAVLDIIWTDPNLCDPSEAPLLCEYRLVKPAYAVILLGAVDIQIIDVELYARIMNWILKLTVDRGIVPILTTFSVREDYIYYDQSLQFNAVLVELAKQYGIPLINLWKAARPLPLNGTRDDRYHLSQGENHFSFNGEETQFGVTLRNLLTLQALDQVRQNVGAQ